MGWQKIFIPSSYKSQRGISWSGQFVGATYGGCLGHHSWRGAGLLTCVTCPPPLCSESLLNWMIPEAGGMLGRCRGWGGGASGVVICHNVAGAIRACNSSGSIPIQFWHWYFIESNTESEFQDSSWGMWKFSREEKHWCEVEDTGCRYLALCAPRGIW